MPLDMYLDDTDTVSNPARQFMINRYPVDEWTKANTLYLAG
jgi:hypothetical protein